MKIRTITLALMLCCANAALHAQAQKKSFTPQEQELIDLSNQKWQWMADKNVEKLRPLFHENAMFVHMGGSWGKEAELNTHSQEVKFANGTGIVYSNIHLTSEVGGHEVNFPFMVSEVYVKSGNQWQLAALIFTRLMEANRQGNTE